MLAGLLIDTLRLGGTDPGDLGRRWRDVDTRGLTELVAYEGAAIWLLRRLRATGALASLPGTIGGLLRQQAFEDAALRLEVEAEAATALTILADAAVPVIIIKGIARCALAERYPYLDARTTQDVDLLIPAGQITEAETLLRTAGYHPALPPKPAGTPRHHHLPCLHRGRITVELHESTSVRVPPEVAWARAAHGSESRQWAGQAVRVPSVTELAWSALAHAMEDDVAGFRLRRFLEVAALVSNNATIDWGVFVERCRTDALFDQQTGVTDQQAVAGRWMRSALTLVAKDRRPDAFRVPGFKLEELLDWRATVLVARPTIGRQLSGRLLAEGARYLTGFPVEASPPSASTWGRIRRRVAGRASRIAFGAWRANRRFRVPPSHERSPRPS